MSVVRIRFIDYKVPINCISNDQTAYMSRYTPPLSQIFTISCHSSDANKEISYNILTENGNFQLETFK